MKRYDRPLLRSGSPEARALLSTLDEDVPPAHARVKTLRAFGLEAPPTPSARPRWRPLALVAAGGFMVACVVVSSVAFNRGAPASALAPQASAPPPKPLVRQETQPAASPQGIDVHALASAPSAEPRPAARPSEADELRLLERAQAAASQGTGEEALALVGSHRRQFPHGRFVIEFDVIEIEGLARTERLDEAAARGERFLATHPASPYAARVQAVVRLRGEGR